MFMGEYIHSIDKKNRIIIPSKLREELGDSFVMTRGYDGCLYVFTNEEYKAFLSKNLGSFSVNNKNARKFTRFFTPTPCETDNNGRVLIPEGLRLHAGITKDIVSVGLNDHIEIWDKQAWEEYNADEDFASGGFAEELL